MLLPVQIVYAKGIGTTLSDMISDYLESDLESSDLERKVCALLLKPNDVLIY